MIVVILLCICIIIVGAVLGKPTGWVVLALGVLALLLEVLGPHLRIG
jgi:hypothetical protein